VRGDPAGAAAPLGATGEAIPARTTLPALGQIACVLRPGSVSGADLALRSFAAFLAEAEDVDEARRQLAAVG